MVDKLMRAVAKAKRIAKALLRRARVVLKAAPTYLLLASTLLGIFAEEVGKVVPGPWADKLNGFVAAAVGAIGMAVALIRRVTPVVDKAERGLIGK